MQLVPGTEVAVAPKRRKKLCDECKDDKLKSSRKALLRIQDPKERLIYESHLRGRNVGIELSSIALIHPETANKLLFDSLNVVVIMPRLPSKMKVENPGSNTMSKQLSSSAKVLSGKHLTDENDSRYAIVHLVLTESVAKGHLMLSQSLCRYLRVRFHSCMSPPWFCNFFHSAMFLHNRREI